MKKKVIGIAAGLILLAAAGGYAGVGHYYASHFFPKTAINGLNCAGLTAEQVKEEIQKHIVDYTLSITERGGKTETLSGTEIGLTYVDDHAVEKLLESQNTLAWPAFYWKEKENQVAADSVYDKEMVQEKLQTMEGFQEEQQEAPTDAYLTDDGTSYVIVPETEGEQVDYEKAEQAVIEALDAGAASVDLEEKDVYRKPGITQDDEALNGEMAELNHLTAARITYAIGENSYAIDRATLQSWLVQGEDGASSGIIRATRWTALRGSGLQAPAQSFSRRSMNAPCRREQPCTVSGKPEPSICGWRKRACESSPGGAWNAVQGESRAFLNADGKDLSRQVRGGIHHDGLVLGGSAGEARRIRFGRPFQKNFLHGAYQIPVFPDGYFIDYGQKVLVARFLHFLRNLILHNSGGRAAARGIAENERVVKLNLFHGLPGQQVILLRFSREAHDDIRGDG